MRRFRYEAAAALSDTHEYTSTQVPLLVLILELTSTMNEYTDMYAKRVEGYGKRIFENTGSDGVEVCRIFQALRCYTALIVSHV